MLIVSSFPIFTFVDTHRNTLRHKLSLFDGWNNEGPVIITYISSNYSKASCFKPVRVLCGITCPCLLPAIALYSFLFRQTSLYNQKCLKSCQNIFSL